MSEAAKRSREITNAAAIAGSWASSPSVRRTMQSNRKWNTKPELAVRRALHKLGLRYRIHTTPGQAASCIADVVFPTERVAVFIDGCFWHGCNLHTVPPRTNQEYWVHKIQGNRRRDAETDRQLADAGWLSIRVWEHEDPKRAADRISHEIRRRRPATLRQLRERQRSEGSSA
jgi:DNA mismatch endonuclease, patch repair protein